MESQVEHSDEISASRPWLGGYAVLLLGALGIAFAAIFVRMSETGPVASAFWRMVLAVPVLALFAFRHERRGGRRIRILLSETSGAEWRLILGAGIMLGADLAVWHLSIMWTTVANATLLANVAPCFVALWLWVKYRERPAPLMFAALGVAGCSLAMLVSTSAGLGGTRLTGDVLGILTAVCYAAYLLLIKAVRRTWPTLLAMAVTSFVTAVVLAPFAIWEGDWLPGSLSGWGILAALAMISQVGGQTLIVHGLKTVPATLGSLSLLLQPVVTAALGWLIFAESFGPRTFTGFSMLLVAIVLARLAQGRPPVSP
ncbi:MAG: DMT family transporter [Pseudomonadota bacterium]